MGEEIDNSIHGFLSFQIFSALAGVLKFLLLFDVLADERGRLLLPQRPVLRCPWDPYPIRFLCPPPRTAFRTQTLLANIRFLHVPLPENTENPWESLTPALNRNHSGRHKQQLPKKEKPVSWPECNQFGNLRIAFGPTHARFVAFFVVFSSEVKLGPGADQERRKTADEQEVTYIRGFSFCVFLNSNDNTLTNAKHACHP